MKLYLDSGHGGSDTGALGHGLKEKDINLKIVKYIGDLLKDYDIEVFYSRTTDKTVSLKERTDEANKLGVDFFLSIHVNAGGGVGYEDFIYNITGKETQRIRKTMHEEIIKEVNFKNRGMKTANFHVLRETKMPAMLTENGFIDNKGDSRKLESESYLKQIALGHVKGIVKAFNLKKKQVKNDGLWKVQTGAFSDIENAERLAKQLESKGFETYIIKE